MSQQHLDRKTVLNIVYTQQATRMADVYETLLADFSQMTAWGRGLESDLSHARVEISFLKAENERLTNENGNNSVMKEEWYLKCLSARAENARLKAENERLRKAGDHLAEHLAHEFGTCPSIEIWNAAKEGKQS